MRRLPFWTVGWLTVGVVLVVALNVPKAWLPSDSLGLRRFQTPEIAANRTLSQTFMMTVDGFNAIEVAAASTGRVAGDVRFELREDYLVYRADVPAAELVASRRYRLEFPPIPTSRGQGYRLDVSGSEVNPPTGVVLLATKGERYPGGTMLIDNRRRWADLAFRTSAPEGRSSWVRLMSVPPGPFGVSRGHVILGALVVYWLVLGAVLRMMWRMPPSDSTAA